jgi:hypothetical protein
VNTYPFEINDETNLVIALAQIDGYEVRLALDTGASNTVIDLTALMIAGYRKVNVVRETELETAKGIVEADIYEVKALEALGLLKSIFPVCSYDFLSNNILTDIDGVLGIDFFMGRKVCIDFAKFEITIHDEQ